jgi:hypothetical protein
VISTLALHWLPDYCAALLVYDTVVLVKLILLCRSRVGLLILRRAQDVVHIQMVSLGYKSLTVSLTSTPLNSHLHRIDPKQHQPQIKPIHSLHKQPCSSPRSSSSPPPLLSPPPHQLASSKPAMNTRSPSTTASGRKVGRTPSLLSNTFAKPQDCWYVLDLFVDLRIRY